MARDDRYTTLEDDNFNAGGGLSKAARESDARKAARPLKQVKVHNIAMPKPREALRRHKTRDVCSVKSGRKRTDSEFLYYFYVYLLC